MDVRGVAAAVGLAMIVSSMVMTLATAEYPTSASSNSTMVQINIFSNQDLVNYASSGTGTPDDPLVIENLTLSSDSEYMSALNIGHTDLYFVLRNVTVSGVPSSHGIEIAGVKNCVVEDCNLVNSGLLVGTVKNVKVTNNTLRGQGIDVGSIWVGDLGWTGNSGIVVSHNSISDCEYGGINVYQSDNLTVFGNSLTNCSSGGLSIQNSNSVLISDNSLTNTSIGISIWNSNGVVAAANDVRDSNTTGVSVSGSSDVLIHHNNFVNSSARIYPWDDLERVKLYMDYPLGGNYWGNDSAVDMFSGPSQNLSGADGIADEPLNFTYAIRDQYPLAAPFERIDDGAPPVASVLVIPHFAQPNGSFTLFGGGTWDAQDAASELEYRWDLNGDGTWDTGWSPWMTVSCSYTGPENGTVRMMVRDSDGLTEEATGALLIDRLAPRLFSDFGPGKVIFTKRQPIQLNWSCKEDVSGLKDLGGGFWSTDRFRVMVNGYELGDINCPVRGYLWAYGGDGFNETSNLTLDPLPDGKYEVVIQAQDEVGNIGELTLEFEVITNPLHPQGPYGVWPFAAFICILIVVAAVVVYIGLKPKKPVLTNAPGANVVQSSGDGERARRDSNP